MHVINTRSLNYVNAGHINTQQYVLAAPACRAEIASICSSNRSFVTTIDYRF